MDDSGKQILKAFSYVIWPIGLISFFIAEDEDKELRFHGAQGLTFGLLFNIILSILFIFISLISYILTVVWLILAIIYALKAYKGKRFRIPIVYDLMRFFYKEEIVKESYPTV